jgi:hypothetical protein
MATSPYFFLSYSHTEWNPYLEKFYRDLTAAVKSSTAEPVEVTKGFRDQESVSTGGDWPSEILQALCSARVLVCIYAPRFFSKDKERNFCGKEFATFALRENPNYEVYYYQGVSRLGMADLQYIVPVLWLKEQLLIDQSLPPELVGRIKYDLQVERLNKKYKSDGMLAITRRGSPGVYGDIVDLLAQEIVRRARTVLPALPTPPDLATLFDPFWEVPPGRAPGPAGSAQPGGGANAPGPARRRGPAQLTAIELRRTRPAATKWMPYTNGISLAALVADASSDRGMALHYVAFDLGGTDLQTAAGAILDEATREQTTPILFIDPQDLADAGVARQVRDLILKSWRGGVIIPAPDAAAVQVANRFFQDLALPPERLPDLVIRAEPPSTAEAFRTAVISVADDVLARIAQFGQVQRPVPDNGGPASRPRVSNATGA